MWPSTSPRCSTLRPGPTSLPAQRRVAPDWNGDTTAETLILKRLDPQVISIDLNDATEIQFARGSLASDEDGPRQATLLFAPGTQATKWSCPMVAKPCSKP